MLGPQGVSAPGLIPSWGLFHIIAVGGSPQGGIGVSVDHNGCVHVAEYSNAAARLAAALPRSTGPPPSIGWHRRDGPPPAQGRAALNTACQPTRYPAAQCGQSTATRRAAPPPLSPCHPSARPVRYKPAVRPCGVPQGHTAGGLCMGARQRPSRHWYGLPCAPRLAAPVLGGPFSGGRRAVAGAPRYAAWQGSASADLGPVPAQGRGAALAGRGPGLALPPCTPLARGAGRLIFGNESSRKPPSGRNMSSAICV